MAKEYTLSEVKEEIYRAAARKKGGVTGRVESGGRVGGGRVGGGRHVESLYVEPALSSRRVYLEDDRRINLDENKRVYLNDNRKVYLDDDRRSRDHSLTPKKYEYLNQ